MLFKMTTQLWQQGTHVQVYERVMSKYIYTYYKDYI